MQSYTSSGCNESRDPMEFRVVVEEQNNAYHAYCPNLKGCHSWGDTVEEAMRYIEEALQFYVDNMEGEDEEDEDDDPFEDAPYIPSTMIN